MKRFYWIGGGVLVAVVLIVLLTGVGDNILVRLLRWRPRTLDRELLLGFETRSYEFSGSLDARSCPLVAGGE